MRITIERSIGVETQEQFLAIYREAYAPLESLAAARQALNDEEFRDEMQMESVLKFVGWNNADEPCAMCFVATDLSVVPWISPAYFSGRFPEHFARNAIYYFGALLVRPVDQDGPWITKMLEALALKAASDRAVCAFDCCEFNVTQVGVPAFVAEMTARHAELETHEVDVQRYYAYVVGALREDAVIDLRDGPAVGDEIFIDLRDRPRREDTLAETGPRHD
jgi:hypothetical protein